TSEISGHASHWQKRSIMPLQSNPVGLSFHTALISPMPGEFRISDAVLCFRIASRMPTHRSWASSFSSNLPGLSCFCLSHAAVPRRVTPIFTTCFSNSAGSYSAKWVAMPISSASFVSGLRRFQSRCIIERRPSISVEIFNASILSYSARDMPGLIPVIMPRAPMREVHQLRHYLIARAVHAQVFQRIESGNIGFQPFGMFEHIRLLRINPRLYGQMAALAESETVPPDAIGFVSVKVVNRQTVSIRQVMLMRAPNAFPASSGLHRARN